MNQDDKQFMMQFMIVLGALLAFTVVIFIMALVLMSFNKVDYGPLIEKQVEERTAPVGEAYSGEVPEGAQQASAGGDSAGGGGEQTYAQACAVCHDSGTAGAPRITDKAAWQPRIEQGKQTLYDHAINGFNAMPPKGGDASLSDEQVQAAVDHIVATVGGGAAGGKQAAKTSAQDSQAAGGKSSGQPKGQQEPAQKGKTDAAAPAAGKTQAGGAGIAQAAGRGASPENKSIYQAMCSACHDSGALGAPRVTDKAAWQPRIAKGSQALYGSAISGIGAMPPKGGHSQLGESEVKKAVDYIIAQVSGDMGSAKQSSAKSTAQGKSPAAGKTAP
ncbi:MAG: c-type cytochrome [Gammaproteobacteria bacterium]